MLIGLNVFTLIAYLLFTFIPVLVVRAGGDPFGLDNMDNISMYTISVYTISVYIMNVLIIVTLISNIVFFRYKNIARTIVTSIISIPIAFYLFIVLGLLTGIIALPVPT